jgi:hypothetical protein
MVGGTRLGGVEHDEWQAFIRCLAWRVSNAPHAGDPPGDWRGPDLTMNPIFLTVTTEFEPAVDIVKDAAQSCRQDWSEIAIIGA